MATEHQGQGSGSQGPAGQKHTATTTTPQHPSQQQQPPQQPPQPQPAEQQAGVSPLAAPAYSPPFFRKLMKVLPYMGTAVEDGTSTATVATRLLENVTYAGPITVPSTVSAGVATPFAAGLSRSCVAGYVRIKAYGAGTITAMTVTGSDGTNTETLYSAAMSGTGIALSGTAGTTRLVPFESEINCTSFIITLTGGTGATVSIEVNGSSGG